MTDFSKQARQLIAEQRREWPLAKANYNGLKKVKTKVFTTGGFELMVQFNPERIRSSAAKVDKKSIEARPCFLCSGDLPPEQRGLPFHEQYTILVNPFPIFSEHLTIPHVDHIDQRIDGKFGDMLLLAEALDDFVVFYNGPKCGASAPDHFHFQAGIKGLMPVERDFSIGRFTTEIKIGNGVSVHGWAGYARSLLTLTGNDREQLMSKFHEFLAIFSAMQPEESEPMLNILTYVQQGAWVVHIFPRKRHRPRQYFEEGDKQILLSPASVDLGGVLITPREEDFNKITEEDIFDIFWQVCAKQEDLDRLVEVLGGRGQVLGIKF